MRRTLTLTLLVGLVTGCGLMNTRALGEDGVTPTPPIPVRFAIDRGSYVTLVIEDAQGRRVRNLVSETWFDAGKHVVYWEGRDETPGKRYRAGIYEINGRIVEPGTYRVRGLVRDRLDLRYEFSVNTAGDPPWFTADRNRTQTAFWLADHSPPEAVQFVPGDEPFVYAAAYVVEGGQGLIRIGLDGRKLGGSFRLGGRWTGATQLTRDLGSEADRDVIAYAGSTWFSGNKADEMTELRLVALHRDDRDEHVLITSYHSPGSVTVHDSKHWLRGLAAHNGLLVASLEMPHTTDQLFFVDAKQKNLLARIDLDGAKGLRFRPDGQLLALVGSELRLYDLRAFTARPDAELPQPTVLNRQDLEAPCNLAVDDNGDMYVVDLGSAHNIKVLDSQGRLRRTIGKPGGPQLGLYDPKRMHNPSSVTLTPDGHVWVAENDFLPKRISIWEKDGTFVQHLLGPSDYGGGGNIDPLDRRRITYKDWHQGTMEFLADWETGRSDVHRILYRPHRSYRHPDEDVFTLNREKSGVVAPQLSYYVNGRHYMTNAFVSNPTRGAKQCGVWLVEDNVAKLCAAVGIANDWDIFRQPEFAEKLPEGADLDAVPWTRNAIVYAWSDLDDDGRMQPAEVSFLPPEPCMSQTVDENLVMLTASGLRIAPRGFTDRGVPIYHTDDAVRVVKRELLEPVDTTRQLLDAGDGNYIATHGPIRGFGDDELKWTYPNRWPTLHAGHHAPVAEEPGTLVAATRLLGPALPVDGKPDLRLWAINGDRGEAYLFTHDGLFVSTLFKSKKRAPEWGLTPETREARRGMLLNDYSYDGETFWPTLNKTADGEFYMVVGKNFSGIVHLENIDSIERFDAPDLTLTERDIVAIDSYRREVERIEQARRKSDVMRVKYVAEPVKVDGRLDEWADAHWISIDENTQAAMLISRDRLHVAYKTRNAGLLENTGADANIVFTTGGGLDIKLGLDSAAPVDRKQPARGDVRLVVCQVGDRTVAMLYRPEAGVPDDQRVPFSSPWRTIYMDKVEDVSDAVELANAPGEEHRKASNFELSVAFTTLGRPHMQPGKTLLGDVGILVGRHGETIDRVYWHNKAGGLSNDVPGEALLDPSLWGKLELVD